MDNKLKKEIEKEIGDIQIETLEDFSLDIEKKHSGSYVMDMMLGGGIASGHLLQLRGKASYGKTTIASIMMKAAQDRGETVAFIDFECTYNMQHAENMGLNLKNIIYCQPECGDDGFSIVKKLIESGDFGMIVIDSIPAARPRRELEGEMGDSNMGTHAKLVTQATNSWLSPMKNNDCTVVGINQWRQSLDAYGGGYAPGGLTLEHNCVQIIRFTKPDKIKENKKEVGFVANMKLDKIKLKTKLRKCSLPIYFDGGVDETKDIINAAISLGIIERKGARYGYGSEEDGVRTQGKDSIIERDKKTLEKIKKEVINELD